jgi:hypothetical protein
MAQIASASPIAINLQNVARDTSNRLAPLDAPDDGCNSLANALGRKHVDTERADWRVVRPPS